MRLLQLISIASAAFGGMCVFWPVDWTVRLVLVGLYLLISTVAVVGELILLALSRRW